jgi:NAD(P)-dependent dehydrogenase (short-subunit alcohol dehydrogenase family)
MYDIVVVTAGVHIEDAWRTWLVNTVGPCYLVSQLNKQAKNKHIIVLSTYGATWTSWPGITDARLNYNNSKLALSNFMMGLTHQGGSSNRITILEPSAFQSTMSDHTGAEIKSIVDQIDHTISSPVHIMKLTVKK